MRIDLSSIDREQFSVKEGVFCNIPAVLVTPALQGTQWNQSNKHLRSSIWSLEGELWSGGFFKFVNVGENPAHFPMPASLDSAVCVNKIDGSLAIFDSINGVFSCRSRGTFSYKTLDNAADFDHCIAKYPEIQTWCLCHPDCSLLCEITTPNQKIILDYGNEPDLTLIGVVDKTDYSLWSQKRLDILGELDLFIKRPRYFSFSSLDRLLADVKTWENLEGCVIYSGENQQVLHKTKADSYLRKHRFKERVSISNLLDLFFSYGKPTLSDFTARLTQDFDHECMELARDIATQITESYLQAKIDMALIENEVIHMRNWTRKDAAMRIQERFDGLARSVAFSVLNQKSVDDKMVRKLIEFHLDTNSQAS